MKKDIKIASTAAEILACWDVIHALRPHLKKEKLVSQIKEMQQSGAYHAAYIEEDNKPVAYAGFRELLMLYNGRTFYIDDLSTLPAYRKKGYGKQLLDYIINLAKEKNLDGVELDSGVHRFDAHRLYLSTRFSITCHHFSLRISHE